MPAQVKSLHLKIKLGNFVVTNRLAAAGKKT